MARIRNALGGIKKACYLLALLSALVFSFAPARFSLLRGKAQTATYTLSSGEIILQSADAPAPAALVRGRALSFSKNAFTVEELLSFFGAKALECERAAEVTLYHAYSPCLGEGEQLACGRVNLQIAVGKGYVAVATPVFYGSF